MSRHACTSMARPHARKARLPRRWLCRLPSPALGQHEPSSTRARASHGGTQQHAGPEGFIFGRPAGLPNHASRRSGGGLDQPRPLAAPSTCASHLEVDIDHLASHLAGSFATHAAHVVQHGRAQHQPPRPCCGPRGRRWQRRRACVDGSLARARVGEGSTLELTRSSAFKLG